MRYSRRFIVMTGLVLLAVFLKFNTFYTDFGRIDTTGQADIVTELWYDNVSADLKKEGISLYLGDELALDTNSGIYMDQNLNLMVPVDEVQQLLQCSARVYNENTVIVMKREDTLEASLDSSAGTLNGTQYELGSGLSEVDGDYYVPIATVAQALGYSYLWNAKEHRIELRDLSETDSFLPSSFDLRNYARTSLIRDQGKYGTCWAFAALSSLESTLLPENNVILSSDHMTIQSNFSIRQETGGAYTMAMAYLAGWQGPVLEKDDPYGDGVSPEGLKPVMHIQEMRIFRDKDYQAIKEAVFLYGGVQSSIYNDLKNAYSSSDYYNKDTYSYCYQGEAEANHQVVIVGWDDSYPKENFTSEVPGDGAFICQNSWGEHFAESGYFYISYYDTYIGTNTVAFTGIEPVDNYDSIYQSDLCGWVGQIGFNAPLVYGANVFRADEDEEVAAVGFYATDKDAEYAVYVVPKYSSTADFADALLVAEGKLGDAGYYTISLNETVTVNAGDQFAIVLKLNVPEVKYPLAVEYRANELTRSVILNDGKGFISAEGRYWTSTEEAYACNLCIKAYTKHNQ